MKKELVFRLVLALAIFLIIIQFGIKPMFSKSFIYDSRKNNTWALGKLTKESGVYDLIVVGEEPEGITAAVSAARLGAKTLLIAQGKDLGGVVSHCLQYEFEVTLGKKEEPLNGGIFSEFYDKLGKNYTLEKYKETVNDLVDSEKNIDVIYKTGILSPILDNNSITGLNVSVDGEKKTYYGKQFIDATRDGNLLILCKVPYTVGSEDINMSESFLPARLNFIMEGVNLAELDKFINAKDSPFDSILAKYMPSHINMKFNEFKAFNIGGNRVIIQGLEVFNINVLDEKTLSRAYQDAVSEVKDFSGFLINELKEFKDSKLVSVAEGLYIREKRHFKGEHVLKVNEVLENTDFHDKIALAAKPVQAGKFANNTDFVIGKPLLYSIPLGCIIPLKIDNLLMVGGKISFSSLAASSAGALSTGMTVGESAGVTAVYSITQKIKPREILDNNFPNRIKDIERLIKRQGVNLQNFKVRNPNTDNWVYPEVRELNSLGLLYGGTNNNYGFNREARQQDLAMLLLNGIYRLSPDKYSLELDLRLRKLFTNDKLTKEKAAETLSTLYELNIGQDNTYDIVCEKGYINSIMKLRLKDKKVLTMDDVFYLADYNIKLYTRKAIPD